MLIGPQVLRTPQEIAAYREKVRNRINVRVEGADNAPAVVTLLHPDGREEVYGRMMLTTRQMFDLFERPEDYVAILATSERVEG